MTVSPLAFCCPLLLWQQSPNNGGYIAEGEKHSQDAQSLCVKLDKYSCCNWVLKNCSLSKFCCYCSPSNNTQNKLPLINK